MTTLDQHLAILRQQAPIGVTAEQHEAAQLAANAAFIRERGRSAGRTAAAVYSRLPVKNEATILLWRLACLAALAQAHAKMKAAGTSDAAIALWHAGYVEGLTEAIERGPPRGKNKQTRHLHIVEKD